MNTNYQPQNIIMKHWIRLPLQGTINLKVNPKNRRVNLYILRPRSEWRISLTHWLMPLTIPKNPLSPLSQENNWRKRRIIHARCQSPVKLSSWSLCRASGPRHRPVNNYALTSKLVRGESEQRIKICGPCQSAVWINRQIPSTLPNQNQNLRRTNSQ
jgi:hypothetical protein